MLRSFANFFQPSHHSDNNSTFIYAKKLLEEINAEILYRQKFFIMCTLLNGLVTMSGTLGGLLLTFIHLHEKVNDNINDENLESVVNYYGYRTSLYGFLPAGSLALMSMEIKYFYSELKKYYHYTENFSVSDLSPKLYEKVKDYLKTIQYNPGDLTIEDLQEILSEESQQNSINETSGVYYSI